MQTNSICYFQCVKKLRLALNQKYQLAVQQSREIGCFLAVAGKRFDNRTGTSSSSQGARGRPKKQKLVDILDQQIDIGAAPSTLGDAEKVFTATNSFPMLKFVNEPCSHFSNASVRTALKVLPEVILDTGKTK